MMDAEMVNRFLCLAGGFIAGVGFACILFDFGWWKTRREKRDGS